MENQPNFLSQILWRQMTPSFRMVENAIKVCPKSLWAQRNIDPPIWQQIYHALYGIDYWFSKSKDAFTPPQFNAEVNSVLGEETKGFIEQEDLLGYVRYVEKKAADFIAGLDSSMLSAPSAIYPKWTNLDVILEQFRHFQHHIGYLNRVLLKCKLKPVEWEMFEV
jgi:hypothetical protein